LSEQTAVSELLATQFLSDFGLPMVVGSPVSNSHELALVATKQRFPLVLKTAKSGVAHKSDVGGVVLNISNTEALQQAYRDMTMRLGPEVLVSPMIKRSGEELLLGIISDEQFGPMVVVGFGGVYAELLDDAVVLMPPFTSQLVEQVVTGLHLAKLVQGYRGRPPVNLHQYAEMAVLAGDIALAFNGVIAEVDINPMLVTEDSCLGLDALIVLEKKRSLNRH
jgi:succinyl-CoA synthetase beta subunit